MTALRTPGGTPEPAATGAAGNQLGAGVGAGAGNGDGGGEGATAPASRVGVLRALRVGFSLAVLAALGVVCFRAVRDITSVSLRIQPLWLGAAWCLAIVSFPLLAVSWSRLLAAYRRHLGVAVAVRLWCLAQATRYLPTGLAAVASRAVLASRYGVPRSLSVITMAVEGGFLLAWSALATAAFVVAHRHADVAPVAIGGLIALIGLPLALLAAGRVTRGWAPTNRVARFSARLVRHGTPRLRPLVAADAVVGLSLALKTVAFVLFARALLPVRTSDIALLVGAANIAVVAGLVGVTPAGLGVREGVLIALLAGRFGGANAAAMAFALRVFDLTVELPWVFGSLVASRRSGVAAADAGSPVDARPEPGR